MALSIREMNTLMLFAGAKTVKHFLPADHEALSKFLRDGVVAPVTELEWMLTDKGKSWIARILTTPVNDDMVDCHFDPLRDELCKIALPEVVRDANEEAHGNVNWTDDEGRSITQAEAIAIRTWRIADAIMGRR